MTLHSKVPPPPDTGHPRLDDYLGFLVHDVTRQVRRRFLECARTEGFELTRAQWSALAQIERHEGCEEGLNQARLAALLDIEPVTLVRQLDRLERAGWIERRQHSRDRRVNMLVLTPAARPVIDRMHAISQRVQREATTGMAPDQAQELFRLLRRARENLLDSGAGAKPAAGPQTTGTT